MTLAAGSRLGLYEVTSPIGAGGMGEVYRARDTKLGREVAIKVLPSAVANDSEKIARLEREARLLAAVNHPNIATLHGLEESDGVRFLVMELIEGETLQERIANGPVPLQDCLRLFQEIAEGLEAAHEKGIVHRDLKPANIKITPDGKPKVLDFGLAKGFGAELAGRTDSHSPTMTREGTETGVILGTAAYMSPEQARGKTLNKRTDIWSFGCCLFEALSGRSPFLGETVSDTIARILQTEPEWSALPEATAHRISELLRRCLSKDSHDRLHDIADARIELALALEEPAPVTRSEGKPVLERTAVFAIALAVVAMGIAVWSLTRKVEEVGRPVSRSIVPTTPALALNLAPQSLAVSPDGRYVAYRAGAPGSALAYVRPVDQLEASPIDGSEGAINLLFSPDSGSLGFTVGRRLMKVSVNGGVPLAIAEFGVPTGFSWSDEAIILPHDNATGLFQLPLEGGAATPLTMLSLERGETNHRLPQLLPGGKAVLFTVARSDIQSYDDASIAVASLEASVDIREHKVVLQGGTNARYVHTGHLVYGRGGALFAIGFDLETLSVVGSPTRVIDGVVMSPINGSAEFSVSDTGTLVYAPGSARTSSRRVVSIDRWGRSQTLIETPRPFTAPSLSPDGRYLAFQIHAANDGIWLYELERGTLTLIIAEGQNAMPVWAPNRLELAFTSNRGGAFDLFRKSADGTGDAIRLTTSEYTQGPTSWSPDGSVLAFWEDTGKATGSDIWLLPLESDGVPEPFLQTEANEGWAAFSPEGSWIAYVSDESGRNEIYLRRYPGALEKRQISTEGGNYPVWNRDGRELFYRNAGKMMVVSVRTEGELALGKPTMLYERPFTPSFWPTFSVTPNGQRFIDLEVTEADPAPAELVIVQNWFQELERLVPTDK